MSWGMSWALIAVRDAPPQAVADALVGALRAQGFQAYDPFPGGAGTPPGFTTFVRLFVSPISAESGGWARVVGEYTDWPGLFAALIAALGAESRGAWAVLAGDQGDIGLHNLDDLENDLGSAPPPPDTRHAGHSEHIGPAAPETSATGRAAMPAELERLARARNVNPDQARSLFDRLTRQILGKLDRQSGGEASAMQFQARAMLQGGQPPDWESDAGRRIRRMLAGLGIPGEPDFATVRDAYQAARRLQKRPNASLMDDERAALRALPNALEYIPVYMGR